MICKQLEIARRIMAARILILCCFATFASAAVKLQELYSWNVLDWNYPDSISKQQALLSGALRPENALPVGVEKWRNKLFVTVPRWRPGIPATLNYISLDTYDPSPKLTPYPDWKGNELGNCESGLNTVYRLKADSCNRLWVLDTGTYGYDPNVTNVCPYTLHVYDLNTDQRIRSYVFRAEDIVSTTFIANIALDMGSSCEDTYAYFSDELGYGLIVYSWEQNKSWRFSHSYFFPDPLVGDFNIAGLNFQWGAEGIFGISAGPIEADGFRTLYFSPLSSHTEFSVSTRILRDETKVTGSYKDFKVLGPRGRDAHTTSKVMDDSGVQLYNLIDQNAIGCWNTALPMKPQNTAVADKDDVGLVFPADVKIDDNKNVWVLSDRMPVFLEAELDYSDINFRIYTAPLQTLIEGTICEPQTRIAPAVPLQPVKYIAQDIAYKSAVGFPLKSQLNYVPSTISWPPSPTNVPYTLISQNILPKSQNPGYLEIDFPKQPVVAYNSQQSNKQRSQNKRPWYVARNYEVFE